MKPNQPEQDNQLDELSARLDAGWDSPATPEAQVTPSQAPLSIPPDGDVLDALDADWDVPDSGSASPAAAPSRRSRTRKSRPNVVEAPLPQTRPGVAPLRVSKQEKRDAERKRLAHQAQQKRVGKQQRKVERQEEARRASEQRRAEQQALAERRASRSPKRGNGNPRAEQAHAPSPERSAKQARREPSPRALRLLATIKSVPPAVPHESGIKKLIPLLAIAIVVGATLCFALLRAAGH